MYGCGRCCGRDCCEQIRVVNENWGIMCRRFRACCITKAMLNFSKHKSGDHSECNRHVWYTRCSSDSFIPTHDPWSVHDKPCMAMCGLMMDSWTLGKYMHSMFWATALHLRTSSCESLFHLLDVWLPMWANFSPRGYTNGARCAALTFNEQHRSKLMTSGRVEKTKTHPDGILRRTQRRARRMEWRLQLLETLFAPKHVRGWVKRERARMVAAQERRKR